MEFKRFVWFVLRAAGARRGADKIKAGRLGKPRRREGWKTRRGEGAEKGRASVAITAGSSCKTGEEGTSRSQHRTGSGQVRGQAAALQRVHESHSSSRQEDGLRSDFLGSNKTFWSLNWFIGRSLTEGGVLLLWTCSCPTAVAPWPT